MIQVKTMHAKNDQCTTTNHQRLPNRTVALAWLKCVVFCPSPRPMLPQAVLPPPSKEFQLKMSQLFAQLLPTPVTGTPSPWMERGMTLSWKCSTIRIGWSWYWGLPAIEAQKFWICPWAPRRSCWNACLSFSHMWAKSSCGRKIFWSASCHVPGCLPLKGILSWKPSGSLQSTMETKSLCMLPGKAPLPPIEASLL